MSQVAVAKPAETSGPASRLELSRAQMNVVFVTVLLGLLLPSGTANPSPTPSRATQGSRSRWNPGREPTGTMPHHLGPNRDCATSSRSSGPTEVGIARL
jgi:hypothetical protein